MKAKAYAKINFYLEVLGKRDDGYHNIETIMQEISLSDDLEFSFYDKDEVKLSVLGRYAVSNDESNIVYKAIMFIKRRFNISKGVSVVLTKNIPFGAGLGGGSSDAATCIKIITSAWGIKLNDKDFVDIAFNIGADVPFFLIGGRCFAEGVGEKLTKMDHLDKHKIILVFPEFILNTVDVYKKLTKDYKKCTISPILDSFSFQSNMFNRFEDFVIEINPEIKYIKKILLEFGANQSLMSGSGSSIFALVDSVEIAYSIKERLSRIANYSIWILDTL